MGNEPKHWYDTWAARVTVTIGILVVLVAVGRWIGNTETRISSLEQRVTEVEKQKGSSPQTLPSSRTRSCQSLVDELMLAYRTGNPRTREIEQQVEAFRCQEFTNMSFDVPKGAEPQ